MTVALFRRRSKPVLSLALATAGLLALRVARRRRRIRLSGRVAVVTGGARGLGLAISRELAARGCRLAICGRDAAVVERAVEALRQGGATVFGAGCDAADPTAVGQFMAAVVERFGTIDILVNNAGQCFVGPAAELAAADVDRALRNIFWLEYYPTMAVLPHMRERGFGCIANITSIGGRVPVPHQAAYVAGKYAATGWSHTLAVELSRDGIRVSTITPPPLRNGAPLHAHFSGRAEEEFTWFAKVLTSPWLASSADRTAHVVVDAIEHGDADRSVSVSAWLCARAYGAAPNWTLALLSAMERWLPAPPIAGTNSPMKLGFEIAAHSGNALVRSLARAAERDERSYLPGPERSG